MARTYPVACSGVRHRNFDSIDGKNIDFLPLLYIPTQILAYNLVGDVTTGLHTWNYTDCDIFSNGRVHSALIESLVVNSTENRTINYGELIYNTEIKSINYNYQEESWEGENYSIIGFFGNTFVPLRSEAGPVWKSNPGKLARLTFDSKDKYDLRTGKPLYLGNGYAIEVKQVSTDKKKVWLEFTREGEFIDDEIISVCSDDSTWRVKLNDINGEDNVIVLRVHVNKIFKENIDDITQIEGIWLIDYKNAFTIRPGDNFGLLTVSSIGDDYLEMKNHEPITLERNSAHEIAEGLNFKVLDSPELIYYPFKEVTINLEKNPLINSFFPLNSEISTPEGKVQEFSISTDKISNITLFINGNEIISKNSTTCFSYQNNNFPKGIYYIRAVARTEDEEALHSWIWIVGNEIEDSDSNENGGRNSGSSSSSGGGAGGSPEPANNVEIKELSQAFVTNGKRVKFDFTHNVTSIKSIEFDAKKTFGKTTAIVEILKGKSQLASQLAPGIIYKNINIWVGNDGMSSVENIENAIVDFKVEKSWVTEKHVNISSISLYRYNDNTWNVLQTVTAGEDDKYVYFRAETPGFSPFAVTGEREAEATNLKTIPKIEGVNKTYAGNENSTSSKTQENIKSPGFESWLLIFGLLCGAERLRMRKSEVSIRIKKDMGGRFQ